MKELTIFTPTFNRVEFIKRLYNSLLSQSNKNFCWLIVDDGSTDDTDKYIKSIIETNIIDIRYYYQKNRGKYVALNKGAELCDTRLFICIDSDDYLDTVAVDTLIHESEKIENNRNCVGIVFPRIMNDNNGQNMCELFKYDLYGNLQSFYEKKYIKGETSILFKSYILKEYSFPEIANENFMSEEVLYNMINLKYNFYFSNKSFCFSEYYDDGLTSNLVKIRWKNPTATLILFQSKAATNISIFRKIQYTSLYLAWRRVNKVRCDKYFNIPFYNYVFCLPLYFYYYFFFRNKKSKI